MGLVYKTSIICDKCGKTGKSWDCAIGKKDATDIARSYGWSIGKFGWFCPECQKKEKEKVNG